MFLNQKAFSNNKMTDLSVIIPAYNEEKNIVLLYHKLKNVLDNLNRKYEIIFINDGSTDKTLSVLKGIKDKKVKIISFQKNIGKSASLSVGFKEASGDIIITMDADLQDEPGEIPRFIAALKGYDMVSGWKHKRKDPISKIIPSRIFNFLVSKVTGVKIHDFNCGFKAYKKNVVKRIYVYGELHRYIPALAKWKGFKVGEIKVEHHKRMFGKSKYGISRIGNGFFDLITVKFLMTFGKKPLHFFGSIGFLCTLLGMIVGIYLTRLWFLGESIGQRPLLILSVLLVVLGVQFISIGLLGEMICRNREEGGIIIKN